SVFPRKLVAAAEIAHGISTITMALKLHGRAVLNMNVSPGQRKSVKRFRINPFKGTSFISRINSCVNF
ncbi:MAG: hypothetical protein IIW08_10345, partial [Clostridia bacterium]|nr:hypothetical protein [Clostridia bacterium]